MTTHLAQQIRRARNQAAGDIIPVWEQGLEQFPPHDLKRFAEDGYGKNSLIYSCIREKATSFAPLEPYIERRAPGGAKAPFHNHRMLELLRNPAPHLDADDFQEQIATQYSAAGNVYIQKVRESADPDRRRQFRGWPVQELSPIRPDYVTISPGSKPADDVFLVTVGGSVRARIPRRDMIHIRTQHLTNDYYGLSPIAVLAREGAIDLEMSDFELAFFRNAGVPMGLLNVKGRSLTKDQIKETKSAFRAAYNGLKRWFDLLVLNADEAQYQQMGLPQNQMEMDATRFHVESRICGVLGVPGLLVGARFAIENGSSAGNYEQAQLQFWSETMAPDASRFARAWTKELLPEFATTADRGAVVRYDLTGIRALQEDLSRKLREVVRMINTGAVMVSEAFRIVGLTPPPNSDFYLRSGNQAAIDADGKVIVPAQPAGESGEPEADNPLEGAARLDPAAAVSEVERLTIFRSPNGPA